MFIRYKCLKHGEKSYTYAYKVKNRWLKSKRQSRQKVIKYIGKVENLESFKVKEIFERDNYTCLKCGKKEDLTIDHIIPLSKNGTNGNSNLQTLCMGCNQKKGVTIPNFGYKQGI